MRRGSGSTALRPPPFSTVDHEWFAPSRRGERARRPVVARELDDGRPVGAVWFVLTGRSRPRGRWTRPDGAAESCGRIRRAPAVARRGRASLSLRPSLSRMQQ